MFRTQSKVEKGRVVAHELGHLFTHSTTHRTTGLMRARFAPRDVLTSDVSRFEISTEDTREIERFVQAGRRDTGVAPTLPPNAAPSAWWPKHSPKVGTGGSKGCSRSRRRKVVPGWVP